MGCTWCIPSRRCAPTPPPTPARLPRKPSCRKRHERPSSAMRSRASNPPTPPKPSANGSRPPTPRPGPSAPPPHPAPPATTTPGRGRTRARGGQGTPRGTQGRGHRGIPSEGRHPEGQGAGRDTTWGQETTQERGSGRSGDQGTEKKGTTANATTHTQEGHTTTGEPAPPHPHQTPHDSQRRIPQHAPPKQASDAVRITPAHTHQPPETRQGMEGTPTRGERDTPTEEAAGNAAARRTTTPSAPGNDPGRHKTTSQAPEEDEGTATATRARDRNPQRTRDQGTASQGGQPHGRLPDPLARAARPGPHSTDPARHPHLTAPPRHQPATLWPALYTTTQARLTSTDPPRHNARPQHTAPQRATVQRATARRDATRHRAAQHGTTDPSLKD